MEALLASTPAIVLNSSFVQTTLISIIPFDFSSPFSLFSGIYKHENTFFFVLLVTQQKKVADRLKRNLTDTSLAGTWFLNSITTAKPSPSTCITCNIANKGAAPLFLTFFSPSSLFLFSPALLLIIRRPVERNSLLNF